MQAAVNLIGYTGVYPSDDGCVLHPDFGDTISCEFDIYSSNYGGSNLGILFSGDIIPVFYEVNWKTTKKIDYSDWF